MTGMTIGRLAKAADVNIDTIRYYERSGLLPAPQRRASGYRSYTDDAVARLRFIRRAKSLGFTLEEIGELMALSGGRDMAAVRATAARKLTEVDARIRALQGIKRGLVTLVDRCPGHGDARDCPIIRALNAEHAEIQ